VYGDIHVRLCFLYVTGFGFEFGLHLHLYSIWCRDRFEFIHMHKHTRARTRAKMPWQPKFSRSSTTRQHCRHHTEAIYALWWAANSRHISHQTNLSVTNHRREAGQTAFITTLRDHPRGRNCTVKSMGAIYRSARIPQCATTLTAVAWREFKRLFLV